MKISIIIPTYKEPEALDLCLKSCIQGLGNTFNLVNIEIIVIVDGFYDLNKEILEKYKEYINILPLDINQGMVRAMNLGVYNAQYNWILIVNDDNVFPYGWYDELKNYNNYSDSVISINQIEPIPSMFKQFHIKDLGRDPKTFDLKYFWDYERLISQHKCESSGNTAPFLIRKTDYLRVGGWDESYPGPWVVDWEFFMKCRFNGMKMYRIYNFHMYHFVSLGTKTLDSIENSKKIEQQCHEWAVYKWGYPIKHNPIDNSKFIDVF